MTDPRRRPRVLVLSHAYHEPEHRKTLLALGEHVDVRVVAPTSLPVPRHFFKPNDLDVSPRARELFMPIRPIYRPGSPFIAQYALASLSLGMRRFRPDVIHLDYQPWGPIFWQALLARRLFAPRARIVLTAKKNTYRRYGGLLGGLKDRLATSGLRRVDYILAASAKAATLYEQTFGFPPYRIAVVTQIGVDGEAFAPPEAAEPTATGATVVGYCGRLEEEKGVPELVAAVERVREETGREVSLRLLGSGTLQGELAALARDRPWLRPLGSVPAEEVPAFMAGLDVFVLPTRVEDDHEEHDAHALLEAMTAGIAVVGTRSGAIVDVLEDGTGLLVPPQDVEALSTALARLAQEPEARRRYAEAGRTKAGREFVLPAVARSQATVYERLSR